MIGQHVPPLNTGSNETDTDYDSDAPNTIKVHSLDVEKLKKKRAKTARDRGGKKTKMDFKAAKIRPSSARARPITPQNPRRRKMKRERSTSRSEEIQDRYAGIASPNTPLWKDLKKHKFLKGDDKADKRIEVMRKEF